MELVTHSEIKRQEIEKIKPIEAFNEFFKSSMMSLLRLANPRCVKMDDVMGDGPFGGLGPPLDGSPEIRVQRGLNRCRC
jgi:hypothetical protein